MVEPSQPGIRRCMRCLRLFVSQDPDRIRRCGDCKSCAEAYVPRRGKELPHEGAKSWDDR